MGTVPIRFIHIGDHTEGIVDFITFLTRIGYTRSEFSKVSIEYDFHLGRGNISGLKRSTKNPNK